MARIPVDDLAASAADVEPPMLDRLAALLRATASAEDLRDYAPVLLAQVCGGLRAPAGMLAVERDGMIHAVASQGVSGTVLARFPAPIDDLQPLARAVAEGASIWIDGAERRVARGEPGMPTAVAVVPLVADGHRIGALAVGHYEVHAFDGGERAFLEAVAAGVAEKVDRLHRSGGGSAPLTAVAPELPGFLRSVSAGLGGDTVSFNEIDLREGTATPVLQHETNPAAVAEMAPLIGVPQPITGTVHQQLVAGDAPVFMAQDVPASRDEAGLPDAWRRYARRFPVHALIAVPVHLDGQVVGALVAARRRPDLPYTPGDLDFVLTSANRLEGMLEQARLRGAPAATPAPAPDAAPEAATPVLPPSGTAILGRFTRQLGWPAALVTGVVPPVALSAVLSRAEAPGAYRPASLMLALTVALTVVVGFRAGLVAAIVGFGGVWYLTEPTGTFEVTGAAALLGLGAFAVASAGVLFLVARLQAAQRAASAEREVADRLLEETPVGIALFDPDLRYLRINRALCEMNGRPPEAHLGRRPTEVSRDGDVYERFVTEVRDTGRPRYGEELSAIDHEAGFERHWRASWYPIRDLAGDLVAVGATVEETTQVVVSQRRSEHLLRLSSALAGVSDLDGFADELNTFLVRAFGGRGVVALRSTDDGLLHLHAAGYDPAATARLDGAVVPLSVPGPLTEAIRTGRTIEVRGTDTFDQRYPTAVGLRVEAGDASWVTVPLRDPLDASKVVGGFQVSWPYARRVLDHSRTLLGTIGSMAELAMSRIRIAAAVEQDRFRTALDAMLDTVAIGRAIRDVDGHIVDFELEYVNAGGTDGTGRGAEELVGRRVSEVFPGWRDSAQFDRYVNVVERGEPAVVERERYDDVLADGTPISGYWNSQIAPFGQDRYIASTRDVTELVLAEEVAREAAALEERQRVAVELLQRAALPVQMPATRHVEIGAVYQPAASEQAVGGDWYDAFAIDEGRVALVIADVAGHGPEAAAFMVQVRNIFRAVALEHEQPDRVLDRVNDIVLRLQPGGLFVTCCYALLDASRPGGAHLSWALAGHPPPVLVRDGEAQLGTVAVGPPLALFADAEYHAATLPMAPGDRVLLYTDGLVERRDEALDDGLARLCAASSGMAGVSTQAAVEALARSVVDQFDDLAVLCVGLLEPT